MFDGQNVSCAYLNASTDPRFAHITVDNELKLDFGDPNGTFTFTSGGGVALSGPAYPGKTVTISSGSATVSSWSSQVQITAVNVKVGNTSYVYPYSPARTGDANLATGDHRGISHVTFCYGNSSPGGPTAAEASISGRVVDASGMGVARAQVVLINGSTGESKITLTSPFGYYTIGGLDINELYVLNVSHRRLAFSETQRVINLDDNLSDVNFIAQPVE